MKLFSLLSNKWILLLCGLCASTMLLAQGALSGTVIDKASGETIIGASVVIQGTGTGTATDWDGKYSLELAAGTYSLEYSYIGYPTVTLDSIVIIDGEINYQDVVMSDEEGIALDLDVTVTAERLTNTEVAVLLMRKEAAVISDNLSVQEMARYGASDAGGALRKVTGTSVEGGKYIFVRGLGDRYSLSQLNGLTIPSTDPYRNSAQLDLIPTNLIDNISTAKTFSPDQPGNFTGGNVDIRTKKFPDLPTFTVSISGGYNSQSNLIDNFLTHDGGGSDYFGFDNGRAIPSALTDPEARSLLNANSERLARRNGDEAAATALDNAIRSVIPQVAPTQTSATLDHGLSLTYGNKFKMGENTLGLIATASFKQDYQNLDDFREGNWEVLSVDDEGLFNNGDFIVNRSVLNPTLSGLVGLAYRLGANNEFNFTGMYNHTAETTSRTVFGERPDNLFFPRLLEGFQLSHVEQELNNFQLGGEHLFPNLNNLKVEWRGSLVNSSQLEPQTRFFENTFNVEDDRYGFGGADTNAPFYFWRRLEDEQQIGKVDVTIPFGAPGNSVKVGGLYSTKDRISTEDTYRLVSGAAVTRLDDLGGDQNAFVAPDNIGILDRDASNGRYSIGNFLIDQTLPRNNYSGNETITAAYGMLTYQVTENLKFVGGGRVEITDIEVISQDTSVAASTIDETDFLPSANLIYEIVEDFNIRASYSRTLARPTMREISPFTIIDPLTSTFERGNPDSLGRSLINNFDLRLEYFLNNSELIALSGYYKKFQDPIIRQQLASTNNEFQYDNVDNGYLFGIEFELRKDLDFISPKLANFSFVTNASYIISETETGTPVDTDLAIRERNFVGQPEYIINAALNFVEPESGWDVALAINSIGDRITTIGSPSGNRRDQIARSRNQLDFIASKKFGDVRLRVSVLNILDDPFTVSAIYKGQEFIYSDFQRGIDLRFGATYTIK